MVEVLELENGLLKEIFRCKKNAIIKELEHFIIRRFVMHTGN